MHALRQAVYRRAPHGTMVGGGMHAEAFTVEQINDALRKLVANADAGAEAATRVRSYEPIAEDDGGRTSEAPPVSAGPFMTWQRTDDTMGWTFTGRVTFRENEWEHAREDLAGWLRQQLGGRCRSVLVHEREGHIARLTIVTRI